MDAMISSHHSRLKVSGNKRYTDSLHFVMAGLATLEHGTLGLHRHGQNRRFLLFQKTRHPGERSTSTHAGNKGIHPPFHLLP